MAGQWKAISPSQEVKGIESAVALNDIMGVNPIPPVTEARWLADYIAEIEAGNHESVRGAELRDRLVNFYGSNHSVVLRCRQIDTFSNLQVEKAIKHQGLIAMLKLDRAAVIAPA
ncbi:hypothetical protein PSTG_18185 [Puccinia striiformis f. sp. tritici PST-78]|uniref:Uncharacterized protein n=1 Tax=Puccinia striiformis f. sp. tritici PST-78 TaxID=1165861 RepID=A0A0L0UN60_9BASI|nr:hypothetical protein PSTG_18185 [Puccinia striiformis f. sp. tritici PST-78]